MRPATASGVVGLGLALALWVLEQILKQFSLSLPAPILLIVGFIAVFLVLIGVISWIKSLIGWVRHRNPERNIKRWVSENPYLFYNVLDCEECIFAIEIRDRRRGDGIQVRRYRARPKEVEFQSTVRVEDRDAAILNKQGPDLIREFDRRVQLELSQIGAEYVAEDEPEIAVLVGTRCPIAGLDRQMLLDNLFRTARGVTIIDNLAKEMVEKMNRRLRQEDAE